MFLCHSFSNYWTYIEPVWCHCFFKKSLTLECLIGHASIQTSLLETYYCCKFNIICDEKKSYMFSVIVCVQVFMNCIFYINQLWLLVIFFFYHTCMIFAILIFQLVTLHLHYISLTSKLPFMVSVVFEGWMVKSRPFLVEILNTLPHRPDSRTYLKFF